MKSMPAKTPTQHLPSGDAPSASKAAAAGSHAQAHPEAPARHITLQVTDVTRQGRERLNGHKGMVLWFTGYPGAGKSTVANRVEVALHEQGYRSFVLDGDNIRHGLSRDLGFSDADRVENIRRVAEVARLMVDAGLIVIVSFISPFRSDRGLARALFDPGQYAEVFVDAPLAVCEARDPKGLYRKARSGQLRAMTGIDSPYEPPLAPEVHLETAKLGPEACSAQVVRHVVAYAGGEPTLPQAGT